MSESDQVELPCINLLSYSTVLYLLRFFVRKCFRISLEEKIRRPATIATSTTHHSIGQQRTQKDHRIVDDSSLSRPENVVKLTPNTLYNFANLWRSKNYLKPSVISPIDLLQRNHVYPENFSSSSMQMTMTGVITMNNNNPYLSKLLSFDEINNIFQFLDLNSLVAFTKTTKNIQTCAKVKLVWYNALMNYLPEYPPFSVSQSGDSLSGCALEKLQTFITHRYSMGVVTNRLKIFEPRFLHRSMTSSYNGETFVFGGVDCRGRAYSDCWKVVVNESNYSIHLRKIDTTMVTDPSSPRLHAGGPNQTDQYRDHPGNTSASATCVMHDGSPVVFGGIVDGMFSSQFWRLQLENNHNSNNDHNNNNNNNNNISIKGKWINCRLPRSATDDDMPWMADMVLAAAAADDEDDDYHNHQQDELDVGVHGPAMGIEPPVNHPQQQLEQHVQQQMTAFFLGATGLLQEQGINHIDVIDDQDQPVIDQHQAVYINNPPPLVFEQQVPQQHPNHANNNQQYPAPLHQVQIPPVHQAPPADTLPLDTPQPDTPPMPLRPRYRTPPGRWGHSLISYDRFLFLFGGSRPGEGKSFPLPLLFTPFLSFYFSFAVLFFP